MVRSLRDVAMWAFVREGEGMDVQDVHGGMEAGSVPVGGSPRVGCWGRRRDGCGRVF
jgi:hypothetical protein